MCSGWIDRGSGDISHLRPFPQIDMEYDAGEHVNFIELRLRLYLSLKVTGRDKEIAEIIARLGDDVLLLRRLGGNIDDLQQSCVGKTLTCAWKVEHSEVERELKSESYVQPA